MIERWYPTVEQGTNKGVLLIVTAAREGALTGGPNFLKAVGDSLIDSIISDDIPILTEKEKFNETVLETAKRIEAVIKGEEDPGKDRPIHTVITVLSASNPSTCVCLLLSWRHFCLKRSPEI